MNSVIKGRDGIKLIKELFGIEQTKVSRITVVADFREAVTVKVEGFAKPDAEVTEVIDVTTTDDEPETQQYIVKVRKL